MSYNELFIFLLRILWCANTFQYLFIFILFYAYIYLDLYNINKIAQLLTATGHLYFQQ